MRKYTYILLLLFLAVSANAQKSAWDEIKEDVCIAGGGYCSYPYPRHEVPKLTPAPKGYKPFYMSHYGRHGSRWLHDPAQYSNPIQVLEKADKYGKLTARGKEVLKQLREIEVSSKGRIGELTTVGARQHQEIAQRMTKNFPEIFRGKNVIVDTKSSTVMRCALSMLNEVKELEAFNPRMTVNADASGADMWYMVYGDSKAAQLEKEARAKELKAFDEKHFHPDYFVSKMFNDKQFAQDSLDLHGIMRAILDITSNQQSHDTEISFWDLFNDQERYENWLIDNAFWYVVRGPSPITEGYMPHLAENLLNNILESADKAIAGKGVNANLRFGHDACLVPLVCLMELGDFGKVFNDLEDLAASRWHIHDLTTMGANMQLIFYRSKKSDDILVKALLNEKELSMPVPTETAPYYSWKALRAYYKAKLEASKN